MEGTHPCPSRTSPSRPDSQLRTQTGPDPGIRAAGPCGVTAQASAEMYSFNCVFDGC